MSSHHFVKEGQEPALFIVDPIAFPIVTSLLEWSPYTFVTLQNLPMILTWGIKIDGVVCVDEVSKALAESLTATQGYINFIINDTGETDMATVLNFLSRSGQTAVNVMSATPRDYFEQALRFDGLTVCLFDDERKWIAASSGRYEKWLPANTVLQTYANDTSSTIDVGNLRRVGTAFEVISSGLVTLRSESPFWVGESYL